VQKAIDFRPARAMILSGTGHSPWRGIDGPGQRRRRQAPCGAVQGREI